MMHGMRTRYTNKLRYFNEISMRLQLVCLFDFFAYFVAKVNWFHSAMHRAFEQIDFLKYLVDVFLFICSINNGLKPPAVSRKWNKTHKDQMRCIQLIVQIWIYLFFAANSYRLSVKLWFQYLKIRIIFQTQKALCSIILESWQDCV